MRSNHFEDMACLSLRDRNTESKVQQGSRICVENLFDVPWNCLQIAETTVSVNRIERSHDGNFGIGKFRVDLLRDRDRNSAPAAVPRKVNNEVIS